jgi:hypothetical protein
MENWAIPQLNVANSLASPAAKASFLRGLAKFHLFSISFSWLSTGKVGAKAQLLAWLFLAFKILTQQRKQSDCLEKVPFLSLGA